MFLQEAQAPTQGHGAGDGKHDAAVDAAGHLPERVRLLFPPAEEVHAKYTCDKRRLLLLLLLCCCFCYCCYCC